MDNFINKNKKESSDSKNLQNSQKIFGVQEEAVFGGGNMFLVPEFGKVILYYM